MIVFENRTDLLKSLNGIAELNESDAKLIVQNRDRFRRESIDSLITTAVFSSDSGTRDLARFIIWEASQHLGCPSSSIQELYDARARGEYTGLSVPAINIRGMTYDVARTIFRTLQKMDAAACIFEIAKSEIGYTNQRPAEYTACILAAALKENFEGPVFIQGDHVQVNAKAYAKDKEKELAGLRDLIREQIAAGFYNIDIDTSTLVDLSKETLTEQQRLNFEHCAEFTQLIRDHEPKSLTISVGGEIGEVGHKNSTVEEFVAYMDGYRQTLAKIAPNAKGISKISIQTGTSHGGIPLADGSVAKVKLDFECLTEIGKRARDTYHFGGAVQHGASTLPEEAFDRFPESETLEIHLATGFQNAIYDHAAFPDTLRTAIYDYLRTNMADEKKDGETDAQFIYKTRKKGFGPFKREMWTLPESTKSAIFEDLSAMFMRIFRKLNIEGSRNLIARTITPVYVSLPFPKHASAGRA